jgi:hypothetical protein
MPLVSKTFSQIITFTRASTATFFNSAGVLTSAAIDAPRFDFNPSTLAARGLLIEESRTNSIRNNTMVGAVAGVVGVGSAAPPTNWTSFVGANLTFEIIGTGTESGITYVDVKISGTANATAVFPAFETNNQIVAVDGQTWTSSLYFKVISQPAPFNSYANRIRINDSGGSQLAQIDTNFSPTTTLTRYTNTGTIANASTAFVSPAIRIGLTSGQAYDVTFRIGLPQLELGAFATSVIPTTTTALTRAADVASVNTLSPWYNAAASTVYAEWNTQANSVSRYLFEIQQNATSNNRVDVNINTSNVVNPRTVISGAASMTLAAGTYTAGTTAKIAFAYAQSDYASSLNGGSAVTSLAGNIPSSLGIMYLGSLAGSVFINGYLRRITYYPRRLSNAELVSITS